MRIKHNNSKYIKNSVFLKGPNRKFLFLNHENPHSAWIFVSSASLNRLEFDAYRSDLEELSLGPRDAVAMARIDAAQQQYHVHKEKYERLRSDVIIKLKFLEENKVS